VIDDEISRLSRRLVSVLDLPWERARSIIVEVIAALLRIRAERSEQGQ
jgi:hypothetical protein